MRKHNEGYSMVLVLVVLTVICLVATGLMSYSLSNLQNQRNAVDRLQDQYTAEGKIEQIVIRLETEMKNGEQPQKATLHDAAAVSLENRTAVFVVESGTVQLKVTLRLNAKEMKESTTPNEYILTDWTGVEYASYEISTVSRGVTEE